VLLEKRSGVAISISPMIGVGVFCIIATAIMHYQTGYISGIAAATTLMLISSILFLFNRTKMPAFHSIIRHHMPGFVAGLIFLIPLLISNELGIFALNGADFGSYAGWGSYFRDHSLMEGPPATIPINPTLSGFATLQETLANRNGAWRVGNVSLFAALNALSSAKLWPTFYMAFVGFVIGQFSLSVQLFTKYVLLQSTRSSCRITWLSILLNTVTWLAMSHYTPNVIGIVLTLIIVAITLTGLIKPFNKIFILSILFALLLLQYPESFYFLSAILLIQLCIRFPLFSKSNRYKKIIKIVSSPAIALLIAFILTLQSFPIIWRHFISIGGYNRPGDFVGIYGWSYPSQFFGFADYNSVLSQFNNLSVKLFTFLGYLSTAILVGYIYKHWLKALKVTSIRRRLDIGLLLTLLIFLIPISRYAFQNQWLMVWRSLLMLSPYFWIIVMIIGFSACDAYKKAEQPMSVKFFTIGAVPIIVFAFATLIFSALVFRVEMIKAVVTNATHAAIFGDKYYQSIRNIKNESYDSVFIEYEGTGTKQAGWEFYAQTLSYIFPEHGSGRNEYDAEILRGKRIAVMGSTFKKVQKLVGFDESINSFSNNNLFSDKDNIFLPYSSSWIYMDTKPDPILVLPGLPGKFLFWSVHDTRACLNVFAHANRPDAYLRVTINNKQNSMASLDKQKNLSVCNQFAKGLNIIRFEPLEIRSEAINARKLIIQKISKMPRATETERGLQFIYGKNFPAVNPFSSARPSEWGGEWNLITPNDEYPLNPHVIFDSITLKNVGKGDSLGE
jgi:hypothetical protein